MLKVNQINHIISYFLVALSCSIAPASANSSSTAETDEGLKLKLVANYWEPYTGKNLDKQGIASDLVLSTLNKAGIKATIDIVPWARAYKMVKEGKADGVIAIWKTTERAKHVLFSDSYLKNSIVLLKRKEKNIIYESLSSLENLRIGIGRDYDYHQSLVDYPKLKTVKFSRFEYAIKMLYKDRIDVLLTDKNIAEYHLKNSKNISLRNELDFVQTTVFELPLHFGMSKKYRKSDEVIKKFNQALQRN